MKPFVFSLERMRNYREQVLNKEKNELAKLQKKRREVEEKIVALEKYRVQKGKEMKENGLKGMTVIEMSSYQFLMENTKLQIEGLNKELAQAGEAVARQMKVVIAATKDRSGLDKLEEKQMEEYRILAAKDQEERISEQVTLTMVRKKTEEQTIS